METLKVYKAIKQLSEFKWHMYMPYPYFFLSDEPQNQALSKEGGGSLSFAVNFLSSIYK